MRVRHHIVIVSLSCGFVEDLSYLMHTQVTRSTLMSIGDESSNVPGPGIFPYTNGMPIMANNNLYTSLGIVNERKGEQLIYHSTPKQT
jgi:hypothetical protein